MSIQQNIRNMIAEIEKDESLSQTLRMEAVNAIYDGPGSPAWNRYLSRFATPGNKAELARLTGENDVPCPQNAPYARVARAYLIANSTCGTPTYKRLLEGVDNNLDMTLPPSTPDATSDEAAQASGGDRDSD